MTRFNQTPSKGGKGIGKQFVMREKPVIQCIRRATLRRLATLPGSTRRVSKTMYEVSWQMIEEFMGRVLNHAILYANSGGRKTLYMSDIEHGLRLEVCCVDTTNLLCCVVVMRTDSRGTDAQGVTMYA